MTKKEINTLIKESSCFGRGYDCTTKECIICEVRRACKVAFEKLITDPHEDYFVDSRYAEIYGGSADATLFEVEDKDNGIPSMKELVSTKQKSKTSKDVKKTKTKAKTVKKLAKPNKISYPEDMPNFTKLTIPQCKLECDKLGINWKSTWRKTHYVNALRKDYIKKSLKCK